MPAEDAKLAAIRKSPFWVAGYCATFYTEHRRGQGGHHRGFFARGAFDRAIHQKLELLINHESEPLASTARGTLLASVDEIGVWFEATALEAHRLARYGTGGVSIAGTCFERAGRAIVEIGKLWEISILTSTKVPMCPGTWVLPGQAASTRRKLLLEGHRRAKNLSLGYTA